MFFYSLNSKEKIVHYKGCRYLKNIKKHNLNSVKDKCELPGSKYKICQYCSHLIKCLKSEENELEVFCQKKGLSYYLNFDELNITTPKSEWKILCDNNNKALSLHHKNTFNKEHNNSVLGFHRQNCKSKTITGFMEYITDHDHYRKQNPLLIIKSKKPPRKGSKRWKKQQKRIQKNERMRAILNVLNLIENLSAGA